MDEIVLRGMAKWPNVPAVYGWLALDRRGHWLLKGDCITNPGVAAFIGRNYASDARGCWFFQNGPQRVFVDLAYTPFVFHTVNAEGAPLAVAAHNGNRVDVVTGAWLDENGTLLLKAEHGVGAIHDHDLDRLLPHLIDSGGNPVEESALDRLLEAAQRGEHVPIWLEIGRARVRIQSIASSQVPRRFAFVARPEPLTGEEVCS